MASIFISYSNKDRKLIEPYVEGLSSNGHEIFYDQRILTAGTDFDTALRKGIEQCDCMIAFITPNSAESPNINAEIGFISNFLNTTPPQKLLIPLVQGTTKIPYLTRSISYLYLTEENRAENIQRILVSIDRFMAEKQFYNSTTTSSGATTQPPSPTNPAPPNNTGRPVQYWMLKINTDHWPIAEFEPGSAAYFNAGGRFTADYAYFRDILPGDLVLFYAYLGRDAIVAIFEVTEPLTSVKDSGELIRFQCTQVLSPSIPKEDFSDKIDFAGSLDASTAQKLFPLTREIYQAILNATTIDKKPNRFNKRSFTGIAPDMPSLGITDQLGYQTDVDALAAVIAYKEVQLPIAIGLFGNWGSGKSFFMNKLADRIDKLPKEAEDKNIYCEHIIAVHFNSWHYSDTNLWASLVTKIFDELKTKGRESTTPNKITEIFSQLRSTQQLKEDTQRQQDQVKTQIDILQKQLVAVENDIKAKAKDLKNLSIPDIVREIIKDPVVEKDLAKLKQDFSFLNLREFKEVKDIDASVDELNEAAINLGKGLSMVYSMRHGKLGWALLTAFVVCLGSWLLITQVAQIKEAVDQIKIWLIPGLTLLSQFMIFVRPGLDKINKAYHRVASLQDTVKKIEEKKIRETNADREKAMADLDQAKNRQLQLAQEIQQLETKREVLEQEIKDIASGRQLEHFIDSRIADTRYSNSLGIISWIRKDFEELNTQLVQQRLAQLQLSQHDPANPNKPFIIERIVLFIDDLDRCETDIVVKVLEAINLLLAIPLFVVVVGVDPRWMHNALNSKYKDFLDVGQVSKKGIADSYDYLEKIFQIPLVLKPMDPDGKKKLIRSQFTTTEIVQPPAPPLPKADPPPAKGVPDMETNSDAAYKARSGPRLVPPSPKPEIPPTQRSHEEQLKITDGEIDFMGAIGFLIGDSPRAIKRFVNIYRIIRTHAELQFLPGDGPENDYRHYCAILIMLGILTGTGEQAAEYLRKMHIPDNNEVFSSYLSILIEEKDHRFEAFHAAGSPDLLRNALLIPMEMFTLNMPLVRRFSFRDFS